MRKSLTIFFIILSGCTTAGPKLYSPVIPHEDGILMTSPTAENKNKSIIRATRNAERYCKHKKQGYVVKSMQTYFDGMLISDEKTHRTVNKITFGVLSDSTAYRTELLFRCTSFDT